MHLTVKIDICHVCGISACHASWDPWDLVLLGRMGDSRETTTFEREENWKFGSCNLKHQSTLTSTAIETFDIH